VAAVDDLVLTNILLFVTEIFLNMLVKSQ